MKYLFIIVDCSQSVHIDEDDLEEIGQINGFISDIVTSADPQTVHTRVIAYNDKAWVHYNSKVDSYCLEFSTTAFQGRSNLGQAYALIADIAKKEKIEMAQCCIVLISDGQATDNYRKQLVALDGKREAYRVGMSIGSVYFTTHDHAINDELMFTNGERERDKFLFMISNFLE